MAEEQYLTPKEIALRFQVTEHTVRNYIRRGKLRAIRFGDSVRIPKSALQEFLDQGNSKPGEEEEEKSK